MSTAHTLTIQKSSGEQEEFEPKKLQESITRAGGTEKLAREIQEALMGNRKGTVSSEEIHEEVVNQLKKKNTKVAAKYSLKKGIMKLGPSGYVFEEYLAKIFKAYGYKTQVGKVVKGECVKHEIDVAAQTKEKHIMIEAKYHNRRGVKSNIQVALYTYARFQDIIMGKKMNHIHEGIPHEAWLVTNTKVTKDAIQFAKCRNLTIVAWRYPRHKGLQDYIENKNLYPVTALPSVEPSTLKLLASKKILLAKELAKYDPIELMSDARLSKSEAEKITREAKELCQNGEC